MILATVADTVIRVGAVAGAFLAIATLLTLAGGRWVVRQIIAGVDHSREEETRRVVKEELRPLERRTLELTSNGGSTLKDHVRDMRGRLDHIAQHLRTIEERQLGDRSNTDAKFTEVWVELAHHNIDRRSDAPRRAADKEIQ